MSDDVCEFSGFVSNHHHLRVDDQVQIMAGTSERQTDRIHHKRHIVGDHLHHCVAARPPVGVNGGREDRHLGFAGLPNPGQTAMAGDHADEVAGVRLDQIRRIDMQEIVTRKIG